MLESLLLAVHMLFSIALIVLVLLHSAKGGGMSDMFGGGMGPISQVPVMERNPFTNTICRGADCSGNPACRLRHVFTGESLRHPAAPKACRTLYAISASGGYHSLRLRRG